MKRISLLILLILLFAACSTQPAVTAEAPQASNEAEQPAEEAAAADVAEVESAPACTLDSMPQEVKFAASDGQELKGYFYPACSSAAPVVVLMHWAGGDKSDWYEIAAWLQNRGLENPFDNPGDLDWWDPTWFPQVDPSKSYNVFIFSFRGCEPFEAGCTTFERAGWLLDAQAAMQKASELEGVDATRIAAIGSSIGADGSVDGCLWLNQQKPGVCRGGLSLSPGSYLGVSYPDVIQKLGELAVAPQVWCLADEEEIAVCNYADGSKPNFKSILIPDGGHGNELLRPGLTPSPMQTILDFLDTTLTE